MADHNLPTQTSGYVEFVQQMDYRFDDLARGLDPSKSPIDDASISNLPTDSVGWSSENKNWRRWTGSAWESLVPDNLYSINISGNSATVTNGVYTTGTQTVGGTKTFTSTIVGSVSGNAGTVTNGVYTTGDQTIGGIKTFSSTIVGSISGSSSSLISEHWSVSEIDGALYFKYDSVNKMKLDLDGNLLVVGEVTAGAIIE